MQPVKRRGKSIRVLVSVCAASNNAGKQVRDKQQLLDMLGANGLVGAGGTGCIIRGWMKTIRCGFMKDIIQYPASIAMTN